MRKKTKKLIASPKFVRLLQLTLGPWLRWKFRFTVENRYLTRKVSPPYLVIPNHIGFWDPFQIGIAIPHPVHYVVADANFRSPVLRFLLGLVGSIPITKSMSDRDAVKLIMDVRRDGGVMCLFAEGRRTWDGRTLPVIPSTAKLIKLLKIPVLVPLLEGAYFAHPCWAKEIRAGKLNIRFEKLFDGPELRTMPADEIHERLEKALSHDAYEWQAKNRIPFYGSRKAETIERVLYMCDSCSTIGSMESSGNEVACTHCDARIELDDYGFLKHTKGSGTSDTIAAWNDRQTARLRERMSHLREEAARTGEESAIFVDAPVRLYLGSRRRPLVKAGSGRLSMFADRIEYILRRRSARGPAGLFMEISDDSRVPVMSRNGDMKIVFPLPELAGVGVHNHERLEWYFRRRLYHFRSYGDTLSGYKWYSAIKIALELKSHIPAS
ncbi:MAG: lysophospholipid acyltransferase family protein [Spirochaetota bacterium]